MEKKYLMAFLPLGLNLPAVSQEQPNVILIMADDLGWGDVGFNGNTIIKTPHLDSLANEGLIFERFYSACAVSSPTRASVLTGRNPFRTGVFHANVGILRPEEVTLPELMQQRGYMTGHFGKWHLGTLTCEEKDANRGRKGNVKDFNPPYEHGYMESLVTESKVPTYDPMIKPANVKGLFWDYIHENDSSKTYGTYYWKHNGEKETENLSGDDSKVIMDRALPFMERSKRSGRPFFSVLWFHTPHLPCVAGPKHVAMYSKYSVEQRNYYGCITAMDEQIGRLVSFLRSNNMYENTIICFCSDNGPEVSTPGTAAELRGRKRDLYEGGIRVPSFIAWPSKIEGGSRTAHIASTSDYLPTFVDILSLPNPPYALDGESLLPFINDGKERDKPLIFMFQQEGAVIEQQYKLVSAKGNYELYDIINDPSEKNNMASEKPSELLRMKCILDDAVTRYKDSFSGKEYGTVSVKRMNQRWLNIKEKTGK